VCDRRCSGSTSWGRGLTLSGCCRASFSLARLSMSSVRRSSSSVTMSWARRPAICVSSWLRSTWSVRRPETRSSKIRPSLAPLGDGLIHAQ
jgi:hypothetical protein